MNITLDLKTLTHVKAGISRYCMNLTSHLLKRSKYQYFGIMGPESDDSLIDIEKIIILIYKVQSFVLISYLFPYRKILP